MSKRDGRQKGPQRHAEGQHGERTHRRIVEQLQEGSPPPEPSRRRTGRLGAAHSHLDEDRQQHDEAEKNSEKNRANKRRADNAEAMIRATDLNGRDADQR